MRSSRKSSERPDRAGFTARYTLLAGVMLAIPLFLATTACTLQPDEGTMSRQAKVLPWPFGSRTVLDEVYSPTIVEDVYSLE